MLLAVLSSAGLESPSHAQTTPTPATAGVRLPTGAQTPLEDLLREAEESNPRIRAARLAWEAAQQAPSQVSVLPNPEFQLEHVSVGSPRPFAGFTNNDFAYIGLGVSQDIPYPGKLGMQGEIARRHADVMKENYEVARRAVRAEIKEAYLQLSYIVQTIQTLDVDGELLHHLEQSAELRYRSGSGSQQEILRAQLEISRLLAEVAHHDLEAAKLQIRLKRLLNRSPSFSDVNPVPLSQTRLEASYFDLFSTARGQNPSLAAGERMIERQQLQVDLARKNFYPDFNVKYMWQRTDPARFRAYYMITFGVKVPIYRGRKQRPALLQAETELSRYRSELEGQTLQLQAELGDRHATAQRTAQVLRIYREALLPQARTQADSSLAAYQNGRVEFPEVLAAVLEISRLNREYWQIMADHETAVAHLEELAGVSLRTTSAEPAADAPPAAAPGVTP
jgi:outer membrane protein TolC